MILQVYSVYDKAVLAFLQPFFARSRGEAVRSFTDACNNKEHLFSKNAADYELHFLGLWDDTSGVFGDGEKSARVLGALEAVIPT